MNDTTIVKQVIDSNQMLVYVDTISNKEKLSLYRIKYRFGIQQQRIKDSIESANYYERLKQKPDQNTIIESGNPKDTNPPSFLLIFAAVSALGMIIMRLFRSPKEIATPLY